MYLGKGMDIINSEPERLLRLHHNCKLVNDKMKEALSDTGFVVRGDPQSPLQFIYSTGSAADAEGRLDKVVASVGCFASWSFLVLQLFWYLFWIKTIEILSFYGENFVG